MRSTKKINIYLLITIGLLSFTVSCKVLDKVFVKNRIKDIDGNVYHKVTIGTQVWLVENLKTTTFNDGEPIPNVADDSAWSKLTTPGYCWYNNDISNKNTYGALYNWYTVNTDKLCPNGWRIPTHDEWTELEQHICNELGNENCSLQFPYDITTRGWRGTNEASALKSCRQISSPLNGTCSTTEHPRWDSNIMDYGTNKFGFSALPGSGRDNIGRFLIIGSDSFWWSSTEYSSTDAWYRFMFVSFGKVCRGDYPKSSGFSVRCIKD